MKYLYERISTSLEKQSLQRQDKFGRDNNIPESNWFRDFESGANNNRIELNRLLSILKENDELYVADGSRLTRSMRYLLEILDFAKEKNLLVTSAEAVVTVCHVHRELL